MGPVVLSKSGIMYASLHILGNSGCQLQRERVQLPHYLDIVNKHVSRAALWDILKL